MREKCKTHPTREMKSFQNGTLDIEEVPVDPLPRLSRCTGAWFSALVYHYVIYLCENFLKCSLDVGRAGCGCPHVHYPISAEQKKIRRRRTLPAAP